MNSSLKLKTLFLIGLIFFVCYWANAQSKITREKMANAHINEKNELIVVASASSSAQDFDYLKGKWHMHHKKLKTRLNNDTEWVEFETTDENYGTILNGIGNMDRLQATFDGKPFEGLTLRLFNPATRLWSLYWVASDKGILDPPVVGSFVGNIGKFYGKDTFNGIPIIVMFRWDKTNPERPEWSQAFSTDNGQTWEWNWWNVSYREGKSDSLVVAQIFMPKIISTDSLDFGSAFSPDGQSFYFSRSINEQTKIFLSKKNGNTWTNPEIASFSNTKFSDADPAFSPNGELYFISDKPRDTKDTTKDYDIWKVIPKAGNQWSEPVNVKELNSEKDEFYISFAQNGNAYFASSRDGGYGEEDIYYSPYTKGKFEKPRNLGRKINTAYSEYDPFIFQDESKLIFTSSGRKDSFGKADFYWSIKSQNTWLDAKHFGQSINTSTRDFCPYIKSDAQLFFFSSDGDIKFIPSKYLLKELTQTKQIEK